jgi:molybdopterin converting factor small subunit
VIVVFYIRKFLVKPLKGVPVILIKISKLILEKVTKFAFQNIKIVMVTTVLFFGSLVEIVGTSKLTINAIDTDMLLESLFLKYPSLKENIFRISLNHQLINTNQVLNEADEVALLPAFSGG